VTRVVEQAPLKDKQQHKAEQVHRDYNADESPQYFHEASALYAKPALKKSKAQPRLINIDSRKTASIRWCRPSRTQRKQMTLHSKAKAILTDTHFLVPLVVLAIGLALLITLH
jgi:hypothetical protein